MKTEHVSLIVAAIAAAASLAGILLNQRGALELEREKWNQAQVDAVDKLLAEFVSEFQAASTAARLVSWKIDNAPKSLTPRDLDEYDLKSKEFLPRLAAKLTLLTARSLEAGKEVGPIYSDLMALDECLGKGSLRFREDRRTGVDALKQCGMYAFRISDRSPLAFLRAMQAAKGVKFPDAPASGPYKW